MKSIYNYIAIEGNIGAGKTSLATRLAQDFNAKLILEEFEDNSFLPKFYKEPERYAFPLELSFLAERYQQLRESITNLDLFHPFTISDYLVTKSLIFARKTLQSDEFTLYKKLFEIINQTIPKPDLFIYLYANIPHLQNNIRLRGRSYEQEIKDEYLESIQDSYFDFIKQQKSLRILIIDVNEIDFVHNEKDYLHLKTLIFKNYNYGIHRLIP